MSDNNHWVLPRHTSDWDNIYNLVSLIKSKKYHPLTAMNKRQMLIDMHYGNKASVRNKDFKTDSINHRFEALEFFMLGYQKNIEKKKSFLFSPLGELFLKYRDLELERSKIFITCMWNVQLKHPKHILKDTNKSFSIYPFRLIYKLMNDKRLSSRVYLPEYCHIISKVKNLKDTSYEEIIKKIVHFRSIEIKDQYKLIKADEYRNVDSLYTFGYYYKKLLNNQGVLNIIEGPEIGRLNHKPKNRSTKPTARILKNTYYELPAKLKNYFEKLDFEYPYDEKINDLNLEHQLSSDIQASIYNFLPSILINELPAESKRYSNASYLLELPKLLKKFSLNPQLLDSQGWEEFEIKLTEAMNSFSDVNATWIGGAGNTDIECLFEKLSEKFNVDAKSTKSKLQSVNSKRLELHREKTNAKYTILITPNYSPGALKDIRNEPITILKIAPFSEYLHNYYQSESERFKMNYGEIREIAINNPGEDISEKLSKLTFEKFGLQI